MPLLQVPNQGTGKRIFLQCLHQQRETAAALQDAQPHRPPSQDLVSEQKNERKEVKQGPLTVLFYEPFAV
ncbi:hypothetical protein SRHO_G00051450, partial [Serrasalmus rhombeus]